MFREARGRSIPPWAKGELGITSWAQYFLKYLLGNPAVTCVIPGTGKPRHMADNIQAGMGRLPNARQQTNSGRLAAGLKSVLCLDRSNWIFWPEDWGVRLMAKQTYATPTEQRCVTSYPARRGFAPGVTYAPAVAGVEDVIDIHCHAHANQQDPLALAKFASQSGMGGILYKTITGQDPAAEVGWVRQELDQWAEVEGVTPIQCWAGGLMAFDGNPPSVEWVTRQLDAGVIAIWFPVFNHANTLSKVGGKPIWWDSSAAPSDHTEPLPWDEALKVGHTLMGDDGRLKPEVLEILRVIADRDVAVCFGHATKPEIYQLAEQVVKLGVRRGFIDHPFSPFVDLEISEMAELGSAGLMLNFTYDELSPLLGIDPARMYEAIRAIGVEHVTLSSDAGEPLFPNSVECMRLIRGYMEAFGLNAEELRTVSVDNPAHIVGLDRQ